MAVRTDTGYLMTRLNYSKDDRKPEVIQLIIAYRPEYASRFTDEHIRSVIAEVERQMAPEFEVIGNADHPVGGLMFNFSITEKK